MFGLGWVGVFLPGLPTTIFWILAAFAFLRVNRRMYERIISHRRFGPAIKLFVEEGRVSRRAKIISISAMLLCTGLSAFAIPLLWLKIVVVAAAMAGSLWVFLLREPEPTGPAAPADY